MPGGDNHDRLESLSSVEAELLAAILERLIPSDGNGAGAREARVLRYIDRALARDLWDARAGYAANLSAVDAFARARHGSRFADLGAELQDDLLAAIEADAAPGFSPSSRAFFESVRLHAVQGMFGDPSHGGNAGFVGWGLIGFPGAKRVFTDEDQRLDVLVEPVWLGAEDV